MKYKIKMKLHMKHILKIIKHILKILNIYKYVNIKHILKIFIFAKFQQPFLKQTIGTTDHRPFF